MKFFLLLFFTISIFTFSQEYHFDYFLKESYKTNKDTFTKQWFYSSKNEDKMFLEDEKNKIIGIIYSKDLKVKHVFKVNKLKSNISFIYKYSRKINKGYNPENSYKRNEVFQIKKLDSLKYEFIVYKNPSRKKKIIDATVNLEIGDFDYINFGIDHIIANDAEKQLRDMLYPNKKFIVKSVEYKYNSNVSKFNILEGIQKVDLTIELPKVLKEPEHWSDFED